MSDVLSNPTLLDEFALHGEAPLGRPNRDQMERASAF
jgi:hypothetical protein